MTPLDQEADKFVRAALNKRMPVSMRDVPADLVEAIDRHPRAQELYRKVGQPPRSKDWWQDRVGQYINTALTDRNAKLHEVRDRLGLNGNSEQLTQMIEQHPRAFDFYREMEPNKLGALLYSKNFEQHLQDQHLVDALTRSGISGRWPRGLGGRGLIYEAALEHPKFSSSTVDRLVQNEDLSPHVMDRVIHTHPEMITEDHLKTLLNRTNETDFSLASLAMEHGLKTKKLQPASVAALLHGTPAQRALALAARYPARRLHAGDNDSVEQESPPLGPVELEQAFQHLEQDGPHSQTVAELAQHPAMTSELLDRLLPYAQKRAEGYKWPGGPGAERTIHDGEIPIASDDASQAQGTRGVDPLVSIAHHENVSPATISKILEMPGGAGELASRYAIRNENATEAQFRQALTTRPSLTSAIAANGKAPPEMLRGIALSSHDVGSPYGEDSVVVRRHTIHNLLNNYNTPTDALAHIGQALAKQKAERGRHEDTQRLIDTIGHHPNATVEVLRPLAAHLSEEAQHRLALESPDEFQGHVGHRPGQVTFSMGTNRLRRARDHILASGKPALKPKEMIPGDWSMGRLPNGDIAADKLQAHIDSLPKLRFNVTHGQWGSKMNRPDWMEVRRNSRGWGASEEKRLQGDLLNHRNAEQRHSSNLSRVFQLNLTNDHVAALKEAGVWDTFKRAYETSRQSAHPVGPAGIGWVRWTGNPVQERSLQAKINEADKQGQWPADLTREQVARLRARKPGVFIDEIQSDFGQEFGRQIAAQAREHAAREAQRQGFSEEQTREHIENFTRQAQVQADAKFPPDHMKKISQILFGGQKPNEVIGEAFLQHLRDKGLHDVPVHMHSTDSKSAILHAGNYLKPDQPLPGHFQHTYGQLPTRLGMAPAKYGELATETSNKLQGKATWGGAVRKTEEMEWFRQFLPPVVLGKSQREKDSIGIASVAPFTPDGKLWFGRRSDDERWTLPGGHLEPGESPLDGARRELKEESGMDPADGELLYLGCGLAGKYLVHSFACIVTGEPDHSNDPDAEMTEWKDVDVSEGVPAEIADNLHSPRNITLILLGLQSPGLVGAPPQTATGVAVPAEKSEPLAGESFPLQSSVEGQALLGKTSSVLSPTAVDMVDGQEGRLALATARARAAVGGDNLHLDSALRKSGAIQAVGADGVALSDGTVRMSMASASRLGVSESSLPAVQAGHTEPLARGQRVGGVRGANTVGATTIGILTSHEPEIMSPDSWVKLEKSGEEIGRLLAHPDSIERTIALKLAGVRRDHLAQALAHPDPATQRAAFEHPGMDSALLLHLMGLPDRIHLQMEALQRPEISGPHLQALLTNLMDSPDQFAQQGIMAVAAHPALSREQLLQMWQDSRVSCKRTLLCRPDFPGNLLAGIVADALNGPAGPLGGSLALDAARHPALPAEVLEAAVKRGQGPLRAAAAANPDLPPHLIADLLATGMVPRDVDPDAQARANALKGWHVTGDHLDSALGDVHPDVRAAVFESPCPELGMRHVRRAISQGDPALTEVAMRSRASAEHEDVPMDPFDVMVAASHRWSPLDDLF